MGSRKTVQMNRFAGQQWREQAQRTDLGHRRGREARGGVEREGEGGGRRQDEWRQRPGNRYPPWNRGQ